MTFNIPFSLLYVGNLVFVYINIYKSIRKIENKNPFYIVHDNGRKNDCVIGKKIIMT